MRSDGLRDAAGAVGAGGYRDMDWVWRDTNGAGGGREETGGFEEEGAEGAWGRLLGNGIFDMVDGNTGVAGGVG